MFQLTIVLGTNLLERYLPQGVAADALTRSLRNARRHGSLRGCYESAVVVVERAGFVRTHASLERGAAVWVTTFSTC